MRVILYGIKHLWLEEAIGYSNVANSYQCIDVESTSVCSSKLFYSRFRDKVVLKHYSFKKGYIDFRNFNRSDCSEWHC